MTSRRDFLKGASLLTVGGMLVPELAFSATAVKKNKAAKGKTLGLQTYSLGPELTKDGKMAEVLKKLHDAGYTDLELAGYDGNGKVSGVPMAEYKKMVDDAGLRVMSSHMNPRLDRGEKYGKATLSKISDFWKKACEDHAVSRCLTSCNLACQASIVWRMLRRWPKFTMWLARSARSMACSGATTITTVSLDG